MTAAALTLTAGTLAGELAVERPETNWPGYLAWTAALLAGVALLYWLMRRAWHERGRRQEDLPPLPAVPAGAADAESALLASAGRYHGSTTAGQWLDRIIAHGLGTRSRAELTWTEAGLAVVRPGAQDFFIPAGQLRGARLDKAIAGKVLTEGGLLIVTWEHGGQLLDSGFRADRAADHAAWLTTLRAAAPAPTAEGSAPGAAPLNGTGAAAVPHASTEEGAP